MNFRKRATWILDRELANDGHPITLIELPKFEWFETGSQIRRSVKLVKSTIVKGYGRRRYKIRLIHFHIHSHTVLEKNIDHLETSYKIRPLKNSSIHRSLYERTGDPGRMLNRFTQSVEAGHRIRAKAVP